MENKKIYRYLIVIALVLFMLLQVTNVNAAENEELQYYNFSVHWNGGYYYGMDNTCSVNCYIQCPQGFYPYIVQGASAFIAFYDLKGNSYYTLCSGEFNRNGNLAIFDNTSNQNGITTFTINNAQNNVVGTFEMIYEKSYTGKKGLSYETDKCIYKNIPVLINGYTTNDLEYNNYLFDNTIGALQANKYESPVICDFKHAPLEDAYYFYTSIPTLATPTALYCKTNVICTDLNGEVFTIDIVESEEIEIKKDWYYPLFAILQEGHTDYIGRVSFNYEYMKLYLEKLGYGVMSVDSINLYLQYDYDGILSNVSAYNFDFKSGTLTGTIYTPTGGENTQIPIIKDTDSTTITTNINDKNTFQNITDFITDTISSVAITISDVFDALITLISSSMGFVRQLGLIYQAIFGTSFGVVLQGALLMVIALRFFGR